MNRSSIGFLFFVSFGLHAVADQPVETDSRSVSYANDVEPIFRRNCFGCHQGAKQLGSYLMTDFKALLAGGETGEPAIVPGKPDESYLMDQIVLVDGVAEMPKPPQKPLSEAEVETIRRWIEAGAVNDLAVAGPKYSTENPPQYNAAPAVTSVDVAPDGKSIAVAGFHEVLILDSASGAIQARLVGRSPRINAVRFSPDGTQLAAVGGTPGVEGEVQIWQTADQSLRLSLPFTYDALSGVSWSPDGAKIAFGAADNVIRAIDSESGERVLFQGAHEDWVQDVGFTPDGKHIVSVARDMSCKLTEVETERFVDNITSITPGALSGGLSSVAVHPERNEMVVGGSDGVVKVYRIFRETARKIGDDANLVRRLPEMPGRIFSVAISPDGTRIAAVSTLNGVSEVRVWNYDFDGKLTDELKAIIAKLVAQRSAEEKKKVEAYRSTETKQLAQMTLDAATYSLRFGPDNSLFVASSAGRLHVLDSEGNERAAFSLLPTSDAKSVVAGAFDATKWNDPIPEAEPLTVDAQSVVEIKVTPAAVELSSPYDYCQLVVTGTTSEGDQVDLTRAGSWQLPAFAKHAGGGLVRPLGNGTGEAVFVWDGRTITLPIRADRIVGEDASIGATDFIRDVNPVLSRLGCNAGTCHGAQKGKNGFKLSLRGYDPIFDLRALTDDLAARRINPAAPEESLMLRKPLGETPHQGGSLMTSGDPYHAVLRRWIADGSQLDMETPRVVGLEVFPKNPVIQTIGQKQQVRLVASYADGTTRDVTREAFIESGNTEVATSAIGGLLTSVRRGEAAILARYEGNYAAATLTVMGDRSDFELKRYASWNRVDELVAEKWERVKVVPSELCDDATFIRRVTLDLTGLPPTSDEVRNFLRDKTPAQEKRTRLVDELLAGDAYVDYWTNKWADLLQVNRKFLGVEGSTGFQKWIRAAVAENRPYDQFAREILTASGSNKDNPAASYFKVLRNPEDTMENTTHLFLGIRFNCNKCHDHPFERWTQDQYYEMAAFFGQVALENDPQSGGKKIGGTAVEGAKPLYEKVVDRKTGDVVHARTGDVVPPAFPYEVECSIEEDATRRQQLAAWMTSADNPYFARSFVNRLWGYLMGVGLIEPIDDIRAGNPPSNPALLDHLTESFVESGFDVRAALRHICTSRTYQLGVETNPLNEDDTLNYSHATPRRLPAEVIYDAVHTLTGAVSNIPGMPKGTRAAAITDSGVKLADGFLQNLGRPVRESACECERSSDLQLGPIMALIGGPTIATAIADPKNELERIVQDNPDDRLLAEEIFLRSIGRYPSEAELAAFDAIKTQIQSDHELLLQELETQEAAWAERKAELEASRLKQLEDTKAKLAARIEAAKPEQDRLAKERQARVEKAQAGVDAAEKALEGKLPKFAKDHRASVEWHPLLASKATASNKATLEIQSDRSLLASGKKDKGIYTITFPTTLKRITGLRLEALADPSLPGGGPGLPPNGNFVITEFEVLFASSKEPKKRTPVAIASGKADFTQGGFNVNQTFNNNKRGQQGWAVHDAMGVDHWATYKLKQPIENPDGGTLVINLHQFHNAAEHRIGRFRISATTADGDIPLDLSEGLRAAVSTPAEQRSEDTTKKLLAYVGKTDPQKRKAVAALAEARKPVPRDSETVRLEQRRDQLSKETQDSSSIVRLRADAKYSSEQIKRIRLTAAEDLTWALINSPAFLFNH
ncbi:MAG: DUF1549 domain-containing protein [Planctomycetota bacterium]